MTLLQSGLSVVCIVLGLLLMLAGSVGLLRLPDFYTRTHATSKVDTVGIILLMIGFAVHEGISLNSAKLLLAILFVALANPVGSHVLARAALRLGLRPWTPQGKPSTPKE